jgi:hypothetical protein
MGTASQGFTPPLRSRPSTLPARSSASSGVAVTKELRSPSTSSTRLLAASAASLTEASPAAIFSESSWAVRFRRSAI